MLYGLPSTTLVLEQWNFTPPVVVLLIKGIRGAAALFVRKPLELLSVTMSRIYARATTLQIITYLG